MNESYHVEIRDYLGLVTIEDGIELAMAAYLQEWSISLTPDEQEYYTDDRLDSVVSLSANFFAGALAMLKHSITPLH